MMPIALIDANDQVVEADLDEATYHLTLSWNEEGKLWTMDVRNLDGETLASGMAVNAFSPVLSFVRRPTLPPGEFVVVAAPGYTLTRSSFVSGEAALWYITREEIANGAV